MGEKGKHQKRKKGRHEEARNTEERRRNSERVHVARFGAQKPWSHRRFFNEVWYWRALKEATHLPEKKTTEKGHVCAEGNGILLTGRNRLMGGGWREETQQRDTDMQRTGIKRAGRKEHGALGGRLERKIFKRSWGKRKGGKKKVFQFASSTGSGHAGPVSTSCNHRDARASWHAGITGHREERGRRKKPRRTKQRAQIGCGHLRRGSN